MRKSVLTIAAIALMLTASAQARGEIVVFTAQLLAGNEVPPVAVVNPAEQSATGSATITLDVTRSGSTITAATARFDVSLSGMASNIILSHIHQAGAGVNGPIVVDSLISPAVPVAVVNGAAAYTRSNLTVTPAIAAAILANPAGFYFNVHTVLSPGGVARGQLFVDQGVGPGIAAPTLSEWGAILMTLLIISACTFFMIGRRSAVAEGATADAPASLTGFGQAIDWKLLAKVTLYIEAAIALALVVLRAGAIDVMGAMISGLVVAFIAHLFIANSRRS
jgi:hypothetical protein